MGNIDERKERIRASREYRTQLRPALDRAAERTGYAAVRNNWDTAKKFMILFVVFVGALACLIAPVLAELINTIPIP